METDEEILKFWKSFPKKANCGEVAEFYRAAKLAGKKELLGDLEKELASDETIESAMQLFGWGRKSKASTITLRAIVRELLRIARQKTLK